MFFKPGDTILLSGLITYGFVTGNARNIFLAIPCGKRLDKVTSASISGERIQIRQNGDYIVGSSSGGVSFDGTVSLSILKDVGCLKLNLMASATISNAVNNDGVDAEFYGGTITFA